MEIIKQLNLFEREAYKIKKPIRLIELFAGKGSQIEALKQFTEFSKVEHYKICEWQYKSINAYKLLHTNDFTDYSSGLSKEVLIQNVLGVSVDYNQALTVEQLKRKPLKWLQNVYNDIKATNNLIDIMRIKGSDLEIKDKDKYEYIMTYSFPCQDLSSMGKQKGLDQSQQNIGGTRSGLLWEVERILGELNEDKPQILLMENVPDLVGQKFKNQFEKWELKLSEMGYSNFIKIISATEYGIPQIRRRVFMISILGDNYYEFPRKMSLSNNIDHFLEHDVDKKYFMKEQKWNLFQKKIKGFDRKKKMISILKLVNKDMKAATILTKTPGSKVTDNYILIPQKTSLGYAKAYIGDGVYISRPHQKRGCVQHGKIQTLKTQPHDLGVVINENGILNIRWLTPKETTRLMGFKDKTYELLKAGGQSEANIYHSNGDSIVVTVLMAIFGPLFTNEEETIKIIEGYIKKIKNENE